MPVLVLRSENGLGFGRRRRVKLSQLDGLFDRSSLAALSKGVITHRLTR